MFKACILFLLLRDYGVPIPNLYNTGHITPKTRLKVKILSIKTAALRYERASGEQIILIMSESVEKLVILLGIESVNFHFYEVGYKSEATRKITSSNNNLSLQAITHI